jgi:hypothetical protein
MKSLVAIAAAAALLLAAAPASAAACEPQAAPEGQECLLQSVGSAAVTPAADDDTELLVCRLKQFTTYFLNLRNCDTTDRLCRFDKFLTLLIGLNACWVAHNADDDQ